MSRQTKVRTPKEIEQIFNVLRVIVAIVIAMLFAFLVVLFVSEEPLDSISKFIFGFCLRAWRSAAFWEGCLEWRPVLFRPSCM